MEKYAGASWDPVYGKEDIQIGTDFPGIGYQFQAAEAMRCLRVNETESKVMPLDESLMLMEVMDALRAQWGFKYPTEI